LQKLFFTTTTLSMCYKRQIFGSCRWIKERHWSYCLGIQTTALSPIYWLDQNTLKKGGCWQSIIIRQLLLFAVVWTYHDCIGSCGVVAINASLKSHGVNRGLVSAKLQTWKILKLFISDWLSVHRCTDNLTSEIWGQWMASFPATEEKCHTAITKWYC